MPISRSLPSCRRRAHEICRAGTAATLARNLRAEPRAGSTAWLPFLSMHTEVSKSGPCHGRRGRCLLTRPTPVLGLTALDEMVWQDIYLLFACRNPPMGQWKAQQLCMHGRREGGNESWVLSCRRVTTHVSITRHGILRYLVLRHRKWACRRSWTCRLPSKVVLHELG